METSIYILLGLVAVIFLYTFWLNLKLRRIRKGFRGFRADIEKFRKELDLLKGKLTQVETMDLDLSILEDKIEENTQEIFAAFRDKACELSSLVEDVEERMNNLENDFENNTSSQMEQRLDDLESQVNGMGDVLDAVIQETTQQPDRSEENKQATNNQ